MDRADVDDYIQTAPIVEQGPLAKGGGHADKQVAVLEGGVGVVVKLAIPGDTVKQEQIRAECAASVLAEALRWPDLVPPTTMRVVRSITSGDFLAASVQVAWPLFLPAAELLRSPTSCPDGEIWRVAIFDALALNTDRHAGNWGFIDGLPESPKLIDHGHAFDAATSGGFDFINLRHGQAIPPPLIEHIRETIVGPGLPLVLAELRAQATIDKILDRARTFVSTGIFSI